MEIAIKEHDKFVHLAPSGRFDTTTAPLLEAELKAVLDRGRDCVLDLSAISYISSMGLRVVMGAAKRSQELGVKLILCGLAGIVKEVFEVSGFNTILNIRDDLARAEAAL